MSELKKKEDVRTMFDDISNRYDFMNHFLSFGIDKIWRKKLIRLLSEKHPQAILDVATGTGDLAIALNALNPRKIIGIDIAEKMLDIAREKVIRRNLGSIISFETGDAENLPFSDNSFDAVTVAFGVRNYEDLSQGLKEMNRVLNPGGTMMILEFSQPQSKFFSLLYGFYSRRIIPFAGKIISRNNIAYQYLPDSVAAFPSGKYFLEILGNAGLKKMRQFPLSGGIATIYRGEK
jgi:demethylmenaquinone methyltransferase / 2-methoxy-6-polyprenyl-1,4-benzoquinol methylase